MFELVERFPCKNEVSGVRFSGDMLVTAYSSPTSSILVYDARSFSILFQIPVSDPIQQYHLCENTLYYTTKLHTLIIDITTKQQLFKTIKGDLYPLGGNHLLILTSTTLLRYQNKATHEIDVFDYGITSSCMSHDRVSLSLTSNKVHVFGVDGMERKDLMTKVRVVGIGAKYVVGRNIQKNKWEIVERGGESVVAEFEGEQPVKCLVVGDVVYYLTMGEFRVFRVKGGEENGVEETRIGLDKPSSDFYVSYDVVYLLCGLQLYVYDSKASTTKPPEAPEKEPRILRDIEPPSLIQNNLHETFQHQSQDFQIKGILTNLTSEHQKFYLNLSHRNKAVSAIYKWFSTNNFKATMFALQKQDDMSIVFDCLRFLRDSISAFPETDLHELIKLGGKLICSKYSSHVSYGVQFVGMVTKVVRRQCQMLDEVKRELGVIKESSRVQKILRMSSGDRKQLYQDVYQLCFNIDKILALNTKAWSK